MRSVFIISVFVLFSFSDFAQAQDRKSGVPYQMGQISEQMVDQLSDVPANIRRVAVYKLNYNPMRFTVQEVEYIRGEIETAFREFAGLTVLSPPELEPNDKMKIVGNDSTLQILNIQGRSLADVNSDLLTEIAANYGVQGLVEVSMQKRNPDGLVLSIRMINPRSREIIWTQSFISNPFTVDVVVDKGKTAMVNFGAGSMESESITRADTTVANPDTAIADIIVTFSAAFTYRQPLNVDNSAYIGFNAGLNILRAREVDAFNVTLFEFGATYYQAITSKNEDIDDYRVMLFLNANVQFPLGKPTGEFFSAKPGVMFNLSDNLGLSLYSNLIVSGETLTLENNDKISYSKVGYGIQAVIRF